MDASEARALVSDDVMIDSTAQLSVVPVHADDDADADAEAAADVELNADVMLLPNTPSA